MPYVGNDPAYGCAPSTPFLEAPGHRVADPQNVILVRLAAPVVDSGSDPAQFLGDDAPVGRLHGFVPLQDKTARSRGSGIGHECAEALGARKAVRALGRVDDGADLHPGNR
jgi:hypothetical protein